MQSTLCIGAEAREKCEKCSCLEGGGGRRQSRCGYAWGYILYFLLREAFEMAGHCVCGSSGSFLSQAKWMGMKMRGESNPEFLFISSEAMLLWGDIFYLTYYVFGIELDKLSNGGHCSSGL